MKEPKASRRATDSRPAFIEHEALAGLALVAAAVVATTSRGFLNARLCRPARRDATSLAGYSTFGAFSTLPRSTSTLMPPLDACSMAMYSPVSGPYLIENVRPLRLPRKL